MKRQVIVLITLLALAAAMVPRDRRAVNSEEEEERLQLDDVETDYSSTTTETTTHQPKICASQTPCAWSIYKPNTRMIHVNITNSYCNCREGTECRIVEDDSSTFAYVHRCRVPIDKPLEQES